MIQGAGTSIFNRTETSCTTIYYCVAVNQQKNEVHLTPAAAEIIRALLSYLNPIMTKEGKIINCELSEMMLGHIHSNRKTKHHDKQSSKCSVEAQSKYPEHQ